MQLIELVTTSATVAGTRSRLAKGAALHAAVSALRDAELPAGLAFLAGHPRQDRLSVGWATVGSAVVPAATEPTLGLLEVDAVLEELASTGGEGSQATRAALLDGLLARCTDAEQQWLRGMLLRELRQGASDSLVQSAIAASCAVPVGAVQRAVFLTNDAPAVALAARNGGEEALAAIRLTPLQFIQPMLAATSHDVVASVADSDDLIVDAKLDGARVQVHRVGDEVRIFTRNGNDITARLPEVVAVTRSLDLTTVVLDGEAMAVDEHGAPRPFGETVARFGSDEDSPVRDGPDGAGPLRVFFFDVLAAVGGAAQAVRADWDLLVAPDAADLVDEPLHRRLVMLDAIVPAAHRVDRVRTGDDATALAFVEKVLGQRHEGVLLKDPNAPYAAGRRGKAWQKVKPLHTLDLVVLAVEWGSGRRKGWLSNLHLGAYDPDTDSWVMLGKTFKGLTDEMLTWQTERLLELESGRTSHVVHVRPGLVVEVAIDGFVRSPRYPARIAMRFARVRAHRPDKDPRDADTVATALAIARGDRRPLLG